MWGRQRDSDRERTHAEQMRRIRGESTPVERSKGYWIFVFIVAVLVILAILLFIVL